MVGEMSVRGNVLVGKCPVREVSGRGILRSGKYPSGKCPSGKCQSGICLQGSVSRGSVRSGNCPKIVIYTRPSKTRTEELYEKPNSKKNTIEMSYSPVCFLKWLIFLGVTTSFSKMVQGLILQKQHQHFSMRIVKCTSNEIISLQIVPI